MYLGMYVLLIGRFVYRLRTYERAARRASGGLPMLHGAAAYLENAPAAG